MSRPFAFAGDDVRLGSTCSTMERCRRASMPLRNATSHERPADPHIHVGTRIALPAGMNTTTSKPDVGGRLDVREIPPRLKHPTIFGRFEELQAGESFTLVNDHDPMPLYYQFSATKAGEFEWEYLEEGPETWRVRIGKAKA